MLIILCYIAKITVGLCQVNFCPYNWHFNLSLMLLLPSILVCYWALIPWLYELLLLIMKLTHGPVPHWIWLIDRTGFSFLVFSLFLFQYIYTQCLSCSSLSASLVPHMYVHLRYLFWEGTREEKRMEEGDFLLGFGDSNIQSFLLVFITF